MRTTLILLFLAFFIIANSQSGPGGVGNSSSNFLWLKSNDFTGLSDGDKISSWTDASGNSNNLSQSNSSYQPYYRTSSLNGYPSVSFENTNSRLIKTSFSDFPGDDITVFIINKNDDSGDGIFSYAVSSEYNEFLIYNSSNVALHIDGNANNTNESINDDSFHILDISREGTSGATEFWIDGIQEYTATIRAGNSLTSGGCLAIAAEQDAVNGGYVDNQSHQGEFVELIAWDIELNTAQRIIVTNYLATKYALSISNDKYVYDGTHEYDVAGIGRYNSTNTHTSAQSAGILEISNPASMTSNGEYLLFGHDDGSISSWTTTDCPSNVQRVQREWRLDETGNVGDITITIDDTDLPSLSGNYTMYGIMVDSDGNFSSGANVYALEASGSDYTADNIDISDGDYITICAIEPIIQFSSATGSALESVNANADIEINFIPAANVTVDYSTTDISATAGDDYTAVSGNTATISAGSTSTSVSITVTDDSDTEYDESFKISLSNPSSGVSLGTNDEFTHTIFDNDNSRKVSFDNASSNASESTTNVSLGVSLSAVDNTSSTTVDYDITGGTSTSADYTFSSGTVTFNPGVTTGTIDFTITNDNMDENNETVIISLSNPQNCNIQSPSSHTYTINDNDAAPNVSFSNSTSSATESNSSQSISIELSAESGKDVSVSIGSSGTATENADYTLSSTTFTIYAGNTSSNYSLNIIEDIDIESDETVILSLSSPTNASLGSTTSHTHTILNDDIIGYEGPGGVGKSDYIKLWVRADDIPGSSDGDRISSWSDQSGNSNNLTQSNNSFKPAYYSDVVNGWPVARFDQVNNRLIHNSFNDFPTDAITTIFVNKSNGESDDGFLSYASSSSYNDFLLINSSNITFYRGNANVSTSTNVSDNSFNVVTASWNTDDDAVSVIKNGGSASTRSINSNLITQGGCLAIGAEQDAINGNYESSQTFNGDFTELIIFNFEINSAQRKIIENYLSSKYDISISNDMYAYDNDDATNPYYYYNVNGIGQDNANVRHTDSKGKNMVRINNASSLGNGEYLFWGDDNVDVNGDDFSFSIPWTDTPNGIGNYMKRVWRVDETGNVGTVSVTVDVSGWTYDAIGDIVLMIDSDDGDFENASTQAFSSINGTQITYDNVNFSSGDFFSFGENNGDDNSLPVELVLFEVSASENNVLLKWQTASEINNSHFEIIRSKDGENWLCIGKQNGNGNDIDGEDYSFVDYNPLNGINYYKLKQFDFDGSFSYSQIKSVDFNMNNFNALIYPNPLNNSDLYIEANHNIKSIEIYNSQMQLIKTYSDKSAKSKLINIDFSEGVYLVKIYSDKSSVTKKLIIN